MKNYDQRKFLIYFIIDLALIAIAYYASCIFRFNTLDSICRNIYLPNPEGYLLIFLIWTITIIGLFKINGLYSADRSFTAFGEISKVLTSIFYASILIIVAIFFLQYKFFSRKIFLESLVLFCIFLGGWRICLRLIIERLKKGQLRILKILIAGLTYIGRPLRKLCLHRVDGMIRLFLYLLIAVLPFSKAGVEICFVVVLFLWMAKRLLLLSFWPAESIINRPVFLYICAAIFSMLTSVYFMVSFQAFFAKFIEGLLLYFIIIEVIKNKSQISIIIGLFLCATVIVCVDGIIQRFFTGLDIFRKMPIASGGITAAFNHKNDLGGYLIIPLSIVLALIGWRLYILKKNKKNRRAVSNYLIPAVFVGLFCLYIFTMRLTNSTGAWIALILGILIFYFFICGNIFRVIIISGGIILAVYLLSAEYTSDNLVSNIQRDTFSRMAIWMDAVAAIRNRPIFGEGINTYMRTFSKRHPSTDPTYTHNCYLQTGAEMGIFGLLSFLWIISRLLSRSILKIRREESKSKFLLAGLSCGLLAFLIHSFVDTNLYSLQLNTLFWYIVGLTVCTLDGAP